MKRAQNIVSKKASGEGIVRTVLQLGLTIIMFVALLGLVSTPALANGHGWHPKHARACSKTASAAFLACQNEKKDDYWIAQGNCYNSANEDQAQCFETAKDDYKEAKAECGDQLEARMDLCDELGEDPYDPEIDPDNFVAPAEIGTTEHPANPYFPLVRGNFWTYKTTVEGEEGVKETNTDEVLTETKEIMGVECVVVHDIVYRGDLDVTTVDHEIIEDTYDYYAQDVDGNVWYFGEFSLSFEEDLPSMEGSWIFGIDDAKPGIVMFGDPLPEEVGVETVYRQEFALGDAEDWAKLESLDANVIISGHPEFSCAQATDTLPGDRCRGTAEGTPLEPDVIEHKYYKPNIGTVLETTPDGERTELVRFPTP